VSSLVTVETPTGVYVASEGDLITRQLIEFGAHAGGELGLLEAVLRPGDVVLDVGAHIGTFAVPLARVVGIEGVVVCFEPVPATARLLDANVELNGLGRIITTRRRAVAADEAHYRVVDADPDNTGARFLEPAPRGMVTAVGLDGWLEHNQWVARVDLLKIDTEGMELDVLAGASATLAEHSPMVYAEISGDQLGRTGASVEDIEEILAGAGYRFYRNVGDRHGYPAGFRLVEVVSLVDDELFDVLAVAESHQARVEPLVAP
jgi:FkbM family methyltransferase